MGGRWANGEGGGTVSVWVSGLGSTYLERGRVLGRADGVGMWFFDDAWQKAIVKVALFGTSHT